MKFERLSQQVLSACFEVHTTLGPGLLESTYRRCLEKELLERGFTVVAEKPMPIQYKGMELDHGYRMDLLVNDTLVLELKAKDCLMDVDFAQTLTYLKLGNYPVGLLLNFHVKSMKEGIRRVINN